MRWLATVSLAMWLTACESASPLVADLGQGTDLPSVDATLGATLAGQIVTFGVATGSALPEEWGRARSLKVFLISAFMPMSKVATGFVATVPAGPPLTKPLDGNPIKMRFLIDEDRVSVVRVSFK